MTPTPGTRRPRWWHRKHPHPPPARRGWYWDIQVSDWPTGRAEYDLTAGEALAAVRGLRPVAPPDRAGEEITGAPEGEGP